MRLLLQNPRFLLLWWLLAIFVALRFLRNVSFSYQAGSVLSPESVLSTSESEAADEQELLSQHLVENARECVFDDLARSYTAKYNPDFNDDDDESCWHLEWEYLQIPSTAILNRHQLSNHRLGNGKAGAAFRALIHLPGNSNEGIHSACYAVLKTDLCQDKNREMGRWWKIVEKGTTAEASVVPCVADKAFYNTHTASFLKGEITGMLLHYSYYRRNLTLPPGLMPTWAVVIQPSKLQRKAWWWQWWRHFVPSRGYSAHDPDVVGVILPLRKFAGVWDLYWPVDHMPHEPSEVARTMLPAAQGLEIIHSLGLVHQDIGTFNLALYQDESSQKSLLYDYGLMAAGLKECTSLEMCDYCLNQHIGQRRSHHRQVEGLSFAEGDVYQFAAVLAKYMVDDKVLQELLLACRTASQLVGLLEDWSTVRNEEEEE